jgi:hypothetical protein
LETFIPESGASAEPREDRAPSGREEYVRSWGPPPAGAAGGRAGALRRRKDFYAHLLEPTFASLSKLLNATHRAQLAYQPSRQLYPWEVDRSHCDRRVPLRFEPWSGKGAVAHSSLCFLTRYPRGINRTSTEYEKDWRAALLAWHHTHPVTDWERYRNAAIHRAQGNRNRLIDCPEWARSIDFGDGLG